MPSRINDDAIDDDFDNPEYEFELAPLNDDQVDGLIEQAKIILLRAVFHMSDYQNNLTNLNLLLAINKLTDVLESLHQVHLAYLGR